VRQTTKGKWAGGARQLTWPQMALATALIAACSPQAAELPSPEPGGGPVVLVEATGNGSKPPSGPDLGAAVARGEVGTEIRLSAGVHVVDNPLVLDTPRLLLSGDGAATIIRPLNTGQPVFVVRADGVGIENLVIDARTADGEGRASFAIEYEGCAGCRLLNVTIVGTGAASVRGSELRDYRAEGNRVLDAGDDAFYLHGVGLRVADNVAVRYLDQGANIEYSEDVIVRDNCMASGRMGIALKDGRAVVNDNVVEDAVLQGIYVESDDAKAIVTGNTVSQVGQTGIFLVRPALVSRNRVVASGTRVSPRGLERGGGAGILVERMRDGILQENLVRAANPGFFLLDVTGSLIHLNRYVGEPADLFRHEGENEDNIIRANYVGESQGHQVATTPGGAAKDSAAEGLPPRSGAAALAAYSVHNGTCFSRLTGEERRLLETSLAGRPSAPPSVEARSDRDRQIAEQLVELWTENNPGFLTVTIDGSVMTTEITADLFTTLRGAGMKAIGIVRVPAMIFGRRLHSYDVEWRLLLEGSHVATVRRSQEGAGATISFD